MNAQAITVENIIAGFSISFEEGTRRYNAADRSVQWDFEGMC